MGSIFLLIGNGILVSFAIVLVAVLVRPALYERMIWPIDRLNAVIAGIANMMMMLIISLQLIIVLARYLFGFSASWLGESVVYAFAICVMLGFSVALKEDAHVRVDIFHQNWTAIPKAIIELLGSVLFLLPLAWLMIWTSELAINRSWSLFEPSRETDGLPIYFLFKSLVPVSAILILIQGGGIILRSVGVIVRGQDGN